MKGHFLAVRVYYEDTDASGVVYHATYLRWLERARTEWLRDLGFSQHQLLSELSVGFTLASLSIRYLKPARLDDQLVVVTRIRTVGRASIGFEQEIQYAGSNEAVLTRAEVRVGCVGVPDFRPKRMPDRLEQALNKEFRHVG